MGKSCFYKAKQLFYTKNGGTQPTKTNPFLDLQVYWRKQQCCFVTAPLPLPSITVIYFTTCYQMPKNKYPQEKLVSKVVLLKFLNAKTKQCGGDCEKHERYWEDFMFLWVSGGWVSRKIHSAVRNQVLEANVLSQKNQLHFKSYSSLQANKAGPRMNSVAILD